MKIAIIGAGNVGTALAGRWSAKGHEIVLGVREPEAKRKSNPSSPYPMHTPKEAVNLADVGLVALPVNAIVAVAETLGHLEGKILIDATNSVFTQPMPYAHGVEALSTITGAEVVKGFNTTGYENMSDPSYGGDGIDMFTAGDSEAGKNLVKKLALDAGFASCYDFGGNDKVGLIEQFALAWINLAIMQKEGRDIAFKVLKR